MPNNIILDLCGGTGAWSKPYKDAGYDVRVCTLPQVDIRWVSFGEDQYGYKHHCYMHLPGYPAPEGTPPLRKLEWQYIYMPDIVGILAAPPCTEFSVAKGARPRDLSKGMETIEACMRIIWEVQKHTKLDFWALENPRGLLRRFLGIPKYTFEQWQFGGNKRKATDIWGYFNIPVSTVKEMSPGVMKNIKGNRGHAADWTLAEHPPEYADYINQFKGDAKRAACRAITPQGFAEAFYRANRLRPAKI